MTSAKCIVLSAALVAAVSNDAQQAWATVVESLHTEDECTLHDSSCSVTLLQMRSNVIKKEVPEEPHDEPHWGYKGELGPDDWASVAPDCAGNAQSPISLPPAGDVSNSGEPLEVSYTPVEASNLKIKNNGHALQITGAFGELTLPDGVYEAKQFHIHCPSEHAVEGSTLPCEMHIVHQKRGSTGTADLAVIGILLETAKNLGMDEDTGREISFFRRIGLNNRLGLPDPGEAKPIADIPIDLGNAFRRQLAAGYYHYQGSLTTPPCSETVHWYVMKRHAAISEGMFENFQILFPDPANNRPVQALNGRPIVMDEEEVEGEFPTPAEFHWTYGEQDKWVSGFPECGGTAQSPIDLNGVPISKSGAHLNKHVKYHESKGAGLTLMNNGHALQVNSNDNIGFLSLKDGKYYVKQFHFHFPSEHSVDGKLAAGEMHIVHQKEGSTGTDDLAVVSILIDDLTQTGLSFDAGLDVAFFRDLGFGGKLPRKDVEQPVKVDDVDLATSFATQLAGPFWHYRGSLTTPPCSQTVHWYVLHKRVAMTRKMISDFKELFPNPSNNREIQPRGARRVQMDMSLADEFA